MAIINKVMVAPTDQNGTDMNASHFAEWINTDRYPVNRLDALETRKVVDDVRMQLRSKGCAVLQDFIRPTALPVMAREVASLAPKAHFTHAEATVYGGDPDSSYPDGHPQRVTLKRENGFVAGDFIDAGTGLRQVYHSKALKAFLAACLEVDTIYEFEDPLAQLVVNVVKPNEKHAWHFDSNEFIITVATQSADVGGEFEYAPNIRGPEGENYDAVQAVIEGRSQAPHVITLRPGDLQIFFGRYSLHRVRETRGDRDRHTAIMAYSKQPGMVGKPEKTARIFGRTVAAHKAGGETSAPSDKLTD